MRADVEPPEDLVATLGGGPHNEPVDRFPRPGNVRAGYVAGLVTLALVGTGFLVGGVLAAPHFAPGPLRTITYAGGVGLSALTFGMGWFHWAAHYRVTADLAVLYDEGLVWHAVSGGWGAGRWVNVVSFFRTETEFEGTEASQFRLEFAGGRRVVCAKQIENYYGLVELVQRSVHRALLPVARECLERDEAPAFGAVTLTRSTLRIQPECRPASEHPIDQITHVEFSAGCLLINMTAVPAGGRYVTFAEKGPGGVAIILSSVANYTVLVSLLPVQPEKWAEWGLDAPA